MTCRERLEMYLRAHHAPFAEQHHPTAYTAQAAARSERLPPQMEAKMVVVVADGVETTLVLPASHRLDVERTAMVLRANRLRLSEELEFAGRFPDWAVGAEPPFGNLHGIGDKRIAGSVDDHLCPSTSTWRSRRTTPSSSRSAPTPTR